MTTKIWDTKDFGKRIKKDLNLTYFICLVCWTMTCLLFSKPINNLANITGNALFQYGESLMYDTIAVCFIVLYFLIRKRISSWGYLNRNWIFCALVFPIIWYLINRIGSIEPSVDFIPVSLFRKVKLFDFVFTGIIIIEGFLWLNENKKQKEKEDRLSQNIEHRKELAKQSSFVTDVAIDTDRDDSDLLGFKPFAERMVAEIKTVSSSESVVFGINGEWGEGKTSMINLIRKQLEDESYTVVDFHPWKTNSGKAMNQLFFDALKDGLKNKIWGINWKIDRYADALLQLDKTGISKTIWQIVFQPDSVEKQKDKLAESMKLLDKNLVVVVDDLDRLSKNEIADVLKLMRDTANFPNLVFLTAYDRRYLNKAIKSEINSYNYKNYMDKIVLWEAPIYRPQPRKYVEILKNLLKERLSEFSDDIEDLFSENSTSNTIAIFSLLNKTPEKKIIETPDEINQELFSSIRVIKKFTNQLTFNIKLVKDNVAFHDFYFLYLLRYFYKNYYDRFIIAYHELHQIKEGDFDKNQTEIEKYIRIIIRESEKRESKEKESEKTVSIINAIISNLIDRGAQVSSKSLIYYKNFLNYFHLGNHHEITMSHFSAMLKAENFEEFKNKVDQIFRIGNIVNQFDDSTIIKALQEKFQFEKGNQSYIDYFRYMIWMSIKYNRTQFYQQCHFTMSSICDHPIYSTKTKQTRNELKEFIFEEELQSDFQYFAYLIFQEIKSNPIKKTTYLAISDVFELAKSNFNNYISSGKEITPELINLFYCSSQSVDKSGNMVDDGEIILKMKQKATEQPNKFIEFVVVRDGNIKHSSDPDNYHYKFVSFLLKIFTSYDEFISFLKNTDFGNENDRAKLYLKYIDQAFPDKSITQPSAFLPENKDYRNLFAGLDPLDVLLDWKLRAR